MTVLAVVVVASACTHSAATRGRVSLVPVDVTDGTAWDWTSACRFGPHASRGCAPSAPRVGRAQLAGDAWNLGSTRATTGSLRMSVGSSGGLELRGNLSDAPPCTDATCIAPQANTWVRGYPSVLYGIDQCNATTSPRQSPVLRLPAKVGSLPGLVGTAAYDARATQVTYDVAYDLWLNPSDTKTPCRTDGTVEVMVWTDYDARSLLPDSLKVGTASIPFAVDGTAHAGDQSWSVYVSNVYRDGKTVPWGGTVWLVLDGAHAVSRGTVTVDLGAALGAVGSLLHDHFGWNDFAGNYWLDTVAFGMEFGPANADPYGAGPTAFSLRLPSYCLEVRTTVAAAGC